MSTSPTLNSSDLSGGSPTLNRSQVELQKKYEASLQSKLELENQKLDQELQVRNLQYQLEESKAQLQSAIEDKRKLEVWKESIAMCVYNL